MQNIFIVTLGTREIQFKIDELAENKFEIEDLHSSNIKIKHKENNISFEVFKNNFYENYLYPVQTRTAGKIILENFEIFKKIMYFPLINKPFEKIVKENNLTKFIIVYTDQIDLTDNDKNKQRDTLYFAEIIKKHYYEKLEKSGSTDFIDICINKNVTDIDYQYNYFAKKLKEKIKINNNEINKIYLLPQGGIDQINHAFTLQLLQQYKDKVEIWQQAEGKEANQLQFTNLFLKDLLKNQLNSLIDNLNYNGAIVICNQYKSLINKKIIRLLDFAHKRKEMLYKDAIKVFNKNEFAFIVDYINKKYLLTKDFKNITENNNNINDKLVLCIERLHLSEYYFKINNYTSFTLSLEIFFESIVLYILSKINEFKIDINKNTFDRKRLVKEFKNKHEEKTQEFTHILGVEVLEESFPTQILITEYYAKQNNYKNILRLIELIKSINSKLNKFDGIDSLRNRVAHKGEGIKENELLKIAKNNGNNNMQWWQTVIIDKTKKLMTQNNSLNYFEIMNNEIKQTINNF